MHTASETSEKLFISGWDISNTPRFCDCGAKNDLNHILNCKRGGYVNYRHNNVRGSVAEYLRLVTKDVIIEPLLTPIESANFQEKGNNADKARLDISARVWSTFERTFFGVRILIRNRLPIKERPCHSSTFCMRRKRTST